MTKDKNVMFLMFIIVIFTALYARTPYAVTIHPLRLTANIMDEKVIYETFSFTELLITKLIATWIIHRYMDNMSVEQFILYVLIQEMTLLLITNKSSLFVHTTLCVMLYNHLNKIKQNKEKNII